MTRSRRIERQHRDARLNPTPIPNALDRERLGRNLRRAIALVAERDRTQRRKVRFV
jgi:hypothetical protein